MTLITGNPTSTRSPSNGTRILLVEDDPQSRWVLSKLLSRSGCDCEVAANGQDALDVLERFRPDVILMDMMMPVLDGLEATRRIKTDPSLRDIPVIALTGDVTTSGEVRAWEAGFDDFLCKPAVLNDLLKCIRNHIRA